LLVTDYNPRTKRDRNIKLQTRQYFVVVIYFVVTQ